MFFNPRKYLFCLLLALFSSFTFISTLSAQDMAAGKQIFETNCTACHKLGEVLIGPNLTGVKSRWKDENKLHAFVKNSQAVIQSGDSYAKSLYDKFNVLMPPQDLTEVQIKDVIAYVDAGGDKAPAQTADASAGANGGGGNGGGTTLPSASGLFGLTYTMSAVLLIGLFILLAIIAYTLWRVRNQLNRMGVTNEPETHTTKAPNWLQENWAFYRKYANPVIVVMTILGIVTVLFLVSLYHRAQDLGTQVNYAPEQPIKFNHKIHAGQYGIKCQYCHTGVEKSKSATIPALSTCMNCHNYIKEGPLHGKEEIAKVVSAYTNKKPVRWIRIHNLPDHVYFNHSQHVTAGKVACQKCHGPVQEMERVRQVSTLEMGWCINCHRETNVDDSNPYYAKTFDFVKKHKKYTIAQMGGTECSKCHY
ncbi:MAG: c-type cytochrome [Chitinophagaceae bacterium]|nr:MAG: c-type cytochrome [Chitinophagaceae bacterium]